MESRVISRETIKPSSPTPSHLRHWKLSFLDQGMPPAYHSRIFFVYSSQGDAQRFRNTNMSDRLKRSLSEVLTDFYPLAGRFNSSQSLDCSDQGVEYVEARAKGPLPVDQLVACPKAEMLVLLLPNDACTHRTAGFEAPSPLAVRVTVFDACGGMVIGVSLSHALADGQCLMGFVKCWAKIARRRDTATPAKTVPHAPFNFASLFPAKDTAPVPPGIDFESLRVTKKPVTKWFAFPQAKIDTLRAEFRYQRPTRVEVVSALLFKCLVNVSRSTSSKSVVPATTMDMRPRVTRPNRPGHYLGNMVVLLMMEQIGPEAEISAGELGMQQRKLAKEINGDYLKKLLAHNSPLLWERWMDQMKIFTDKNARVFTLTSLCNFSFNETDMGWGSPTWVIPLIPSADIIMLMDANNGDGIHAVLALDEDHMVRFESELFNIVGLAPNISKL